MMENNLTNLRKSEITAKIQAYLEELCEHIPNRHVGSPGNRAATDFFAKTIASFGFATDCPEFECIDWDHGEVQLQAGNETLTALISPYSLGCRLTAPLVEVSTLDELEHTDTSGQILLIRGDLAQEQLIPTNYPFYIPSAYPELVSLLEQKQPVAIIAATTKNPELAGSLYPFPLIEDGDFNIPSVYMTAEEGERLRQYSGTTITLNFESHRIPARGNNVIARKGSDLSSRLVFCAHIDTKKGTPGALDNATGVATLLALAELLADYAGPRCIEIVAFNGEDYYSSPGQVQYLNLNKGVLGTILLAINLDLAGYHHSRTVYSEYGCPEIMVQQLHDILGARYNLAEGEPWYQSDHSIFIQNHIPALAITSENFMELSTHITHTEKDTLALVDAQKLVDIAYGLRDVALEVV